MPSPLLGAAGLVMPAPLRHIRALSCSAPEAGPLVWAPGSRKEGCS